MFFIRAALAAVVLCMSICPAVASGAAGRLDSCTRFFASNTSSNYDSGLQFRTNHEAIELAREILAHVGLEVTFTLRPGPVGNASAIVCYDSEQKLHRKIIAYNPRFIESILMRQRDHWASIAVLAHEIAHFVYNHHLIGVDPHVAELLADRFAGFILGRMGATKSDAKEAMELVSDPRPTLSHPGREERVEAILKGWRKGAPRQSARMIQKRGTYVEGRGYHFYQAKSIAACEESCLTDERCMMAEYNDDRTCNHYDHTRTDGPSRTANVSMKLTAYSVPFVRFKVKHHLNRQLGGQGYRGVPGIHSLVACEKACIAERPRCAAFQHHRLDAVCQLFDHVTIGGPSKTTDIGALE
jgi:hypothetical protein